MKDQLVHDPDALPPIPVVGGFIAFCLITAAVVLALTPYTYQLDDIKTLIVYTGGGFLLLGWAALWHFRYVNAPPKAVWISYLAYLAVCLASTIFGQPEVHWIGWQYLAFYTSLLGFVLMGSAVVQTRRMVDWTLRFWVLLTFVTTTFGLIHYAGLFEPLYHHYYPYGPPRGDAPFHDLLYTFMGARSMLSTVLNVQFFGNFLLMLLPVVLASAMVVFRDLIRRIGEMKKDKTSSSRFHLTTDGIWLVIIGLSGVFAFACIFTTYSKSSIYGIPIIGILFLAGVYRYASVRRIPYLWLIGLCGAVMAGTLLYYISGDLREQLKNVEESLAPRRIIFGGALNIFGEHPILGGGPGSFRILFPQFRSPDYHLHRVSNLTLYAHNWVLDLLAETGILGTIAYLIFLGAIFYLGWKRLRQCPDVITRVAIIGSLVGIISLLAGALLTPMTRWPVGAGSLHAMLGSVLGIALMAGREPDPVRQGRPTAYNRRPPIVWDRLQTTRLIVLIATLVFAPLVSVWSIHLFQAAIYHNEAWKRSNISGAGVVKDPEVVQLLKEAEEYYRRAIELDPTRMTTYYRMAHVYNRLGRQDKALEAYQELKKYAPDYSEIHYNLGVLYYNLAVDAMEADPPASNEKVIELSKKSVESFDRATELSNKITVVYYKGISNMNLAKLYPEGSPEQKKYYHAAAEAFALTTELPVSTVIQEKDQVAREEKQRFEASKLTADCFAKAGEPELAAQAAERYLQNNPTSLRAMRDATTFYVEAGQVDDALRVIDENLALNPFNPNALLMRQDILAHAGRDSEATAEAAYVLALDQKLQEQGAEFLPDDLKPYVQEKIQPAE